jgi:hypothetical protein
MVDNVKRTGTTQSTFERFNASRFVQSIRRLGSSLLQTLTPSCTRRQTGATTKEIQPPFAPTHSKLENGSSDNKEILNTETPEKTELEVIKPQEKAPINDVDDIRISLNN